MFNHKNGNRSLIYAIDFELTPSDLKAPHETALGCIALGFLAFLMGVVVAVMI